MKRVPQLAGWIARTALALSVSLPCAAAEPQQQLRVEDVIAKARAITDHDGAVHRMVLRGHFALGDVTYEFRYLYEAPNHYIGLSALGPPDATYFAAVDNRALLYDPIDNGVLAFNDVIPGIRWVIANHSAQIAYRLNKKGATSPFKLEDGVLIDVPSILNDPNVTFGEVQSLEDGSYRLVGETLLTGDPIVATIDAKQGLVTTMQVGTETGTRFIQMRVNEASRSPDPVIPSTRDLSERFLVKEVTLPDAAQQRLFGRMALPIAALVPAMRQPFELSSGEAPDWIAVQANMKRASTKLREAFPVP